MERKGGMGPEYKLEFMARMKERRDAEKSQLIS